jgi:hypothetical protein
LASQKNYQKSIGKDNNPFAEMTMDDFSDSLNEIADSVEMEVEVC